MFHARTWFASAVVGALLSCAGGAAADEMPPPILPPQPPPPPSPGVGKTAVVEFRADRPGVRVGVVTQNIDAISTSGDEIQGIGWRDMCIAPCSFRLRPGLRSLTATGAGIVGGVQDVQLVDGENRFTVHAGSAWVRMLGWTLASLGAAGLATGIIFQAMGEQHATSKGFKTTRPDWAIPLAIGGGAGLVGGFVLVFATRTSIEPDNPAARAAFEPRTFGVGYQGKF